MTSPDPMQALTPALDAFRRGTKRSRLRLFAAVCPSGHTLLEVFPTGSGAVALWAEPQMWGTDEAGQLVRHRPPRQSWQAAFVHQAANETDEDDQSDERASVFCRCTEGTAVDLAWVAEQVDANVRRAVVTLG